MFMHSHCAVACGSCNKPIDLIMAAEAEEMERGDWRAKEEAQHKQRSTVKIGLQPLAPQAAASGP